MNIETRERERERVLGIKERHKGAYCSEFCLYKGLSTALLTFVQIHRNGEKIQLDNNYFQEVRASHHIIH